MEKVDLLEQNIADISLDLLKNLLKDKTTGKFILWATDNYTQYGEQYYPSQEIFPELVIGSNTEIIQPRVLKKQSEQIRRTRDKAEVFTPSWVCNLQNNIIDDEWFGRSNVFNKPNGCRWVNNKKAIVFPNDKKWQDYVDERRLEVSCGEAPYLVSRYDTVTGIQIPIEQRIGILDRKLRIVDENTQEKEEWLRWTTRAFQSVYGYEYQGDNVLLARENLLLTFFDYYNNRFGHKPELKETKKIATIISWNIWQMDGITFTAPFSEAPPVYRQMTLFDIIGESSEPELEAMPCRIYDWRANESIEFKSIRRGGCNNDRESI